MTEFTSTQGRYLSFIEAYTDLHGFPPAESEIAAALCVSPPSVNQMVKTLEKKGLILRQPGQPRALRVLVPSDEIPPWNGRKSTQKAKSARLPSNGNQAIAVTAQANLYVLKVFLTSGPISEKFAKKEVSRVIEIRGNQTLDDLHHAIFEAYDRWDEHLYQFQFGKRPFDPEGDNFGNCEFQTDDQKDALTTTLDDLDLNTERVFGYWFDFGDDWYHQIQVDKIEKAIPTVTYPRLIKRVGKSPPQYQDE